VRPSTPPSNSKVDFYTREPTQQTSLVKDLFTSPAANKHSYPQMQTLKVPGASNQLSQFAGSTGFGHQNNAQSTEFVRNICSPTMQRGTHTGVKFSPFQSPYFSKRQNNEQDSRNLFWNSNGPMSCSPNQQYYKSPTAENGNRLNDVQIKGTRLFQSY
jgi:hypothetical protein